MSPNVWTIRNNFQHMLIHGFPKLSTSYFYDDLNTWNFPHYRKKKVNSIFSNYSSGGFKF